MAPLTKRLVSPHLLVCVTFSLFKLQTSSYSEIMPSAYQAPGDVVPCGSVFSNFSAKLVPHSLLGLDSSPWAWFLQYRTKQQHTYLYLSPPWTYPLCPYHCTAHQLICLQDSWRSLQGGTGCQMFLQKLNHCKLNSKQKSQTWNLTDRMFQIILNRLLSQSTPSSLC